MNRRETIKAALAFPFVIPEQDAQVIEHLEFADDQIVGGWCSYKWMHGARVHAYDARGRKIDYVRAVRLEPGGLRVRVLHSTDAGAVRSVLGVRETSGWDVVEFEAFVPGGCLGSYVEYVDEEPGAYLTWPNNSDRPVSVGGTAHRAWIYENGWKS